MGGLLGLAHVHDKCACRRTKVSSNPAAITPLLGLTLLERSHTPMTKQFEPHKVKLLIGSPIHGIFSRDGAVAPGTRGQRRLVGQPNKWSTF